jgi:hypothetical protein
MSEYLPKLFERLDAKGVSAAAAKPAAAARLQLADLLGFHVGLVEEVTQGLGCRYTREDTQTWRSSIVMTGRSLLIAATFAWVARLLIPSWRVARASVIVRRFEKRFPTAAFSAQLARRKPKAVPNHEKDGYLFR